MANKTYTAACFSMGIGTTAFAYHAKGFQILYGSETRDLERSIFIANFPDTTADNADARWFINRKDKGREELLAKVGLAAEQTLDLLDVTAHLTAADKKSNTPASVLDFFTLIRRLSPKVAIAYVPPDLVANQNLERFNKGLDFLRYKRLETDEQERDYFIFCRLIDASLYGSGVTNSYAPNEDACYDLGLAHFKKDGRIVRFDYITDALPYISIPEGKPIKGIKEEDTPPFYLPRSRENKADRSKRKVLAVNGLPATGKSTLMKAFLKESGSWKSVTPAIGLKALYNKQLDCYILGEYVDGETFPGTDRLDMAIQPIALNFLTKTKSHVIFEGDRLFNFSFLEALDGIGVALQIFEIISSDEVLKARHKKRKDTQPEKFIKARETKIRNICGSPTFFSRVKTLDNNTDDDQTIILKEMKAYLGMA